MLNTATAISIQTQLNHCNYINLVSFVILYYDYALTLPAEVERFWASKSVSWASGFFYVNRYLVIFGHIPVMVQYYWDSRHKSTKMYVPASYRHNSRIECDCGHRCPSLSSFHQYLAVIIQVVVGLTLIMRTYALYDRNLKVLLFICTAALAVIIFGTWSVAAGSHGQPGDLVLPDIGCVPPTNQADANRLAAAWTGNLLFDVMIFVMTVYKSLKRSRGRDWTLIHVLLRDGAIYFGIMAIVGLGNIISFHFSPEYERGFITTFANIISSTMLSRLMLNLRDPDLVTRNFGIQPDSATAGPTTTNYPVLSTVLEFNTITEVSVVSQGQASTSSSV
ncbi:hypothetical protein Hypma_000082 [Hypsizygus marmoreus]|uniref:DUF6533 domain-containing protein n=1 Tax=Hypsizygus marmoreus TaxID=39966 RepID=A0A369KGU6_HYPMA|nr:hypothetical protein Hypma_000082 [Hypsizygus marmoreus]